ncbi:MAG: BatA domain-containing protein [Planctomycetes bacterium]|nr:BatA domain-containing protein [Planctomycetota bacterium]MCB9916833.1 BatA domain-containing protein [Planctomycetota bacterium]
MLALSFLNPFLLWGAGLASIPLIIHILNRRRFKKVRWAAMEFLLKAYKENRRRMRFEQLLLLLLRMAVVALLAFLLARPRASDDEFGPWRSAVHHVFVLDESGSMGERLASGTAFDAAKRRVLSRVEALAKSGGASDDFFTLVRSAGTEPDFLARPITLALVSDLRERLGSASPAPARFTPKVALDAVKKVADKLGDRADKEWLYFVSDMRREDWVGGEGRVRDEILQGLRGLDPDRIVIEPVGGESDENLAVVELKPRTARTIRNTPTEFEVLIENRGNGASEACDVGFSVDGEGRKTLPLPSLAPGERKSVVFRTTLTTAGGHWVEADLPKDRFGIDDSLALALDVVPSARILLVDGDPGDREELQETFYLSIAFDPIGDGSAGFEVTRVDENEVAERDLGEYDLILLANVPQFDEETSGRLVDWTRAGGGICAFVGDQVEAALWNKAFWRRGEGFLPAPLLEVAGDPDEPRSIVVADREHELWKDKNSAEALAAVLQVADVGRWFSVGSALDNLAEGQLPEGAKAVLRVGDEAGPPLFIERRVGDGRSGLFTTTADAAWTSWASNPSYLVVMRLAGELLVRRQDLSQRNIDAYGHVHDEVPAAHYGFDVRLTAARDDDDTFPERGFTLAPLESAPEVLAIDAEPEKGRPWPVAGAYRLTFSKGDGSNDERYFAVRPWTNEGKPARLDDRATLSALPPEYRERTVVTKETSEDLDDGGEFWRVLAFALLAGLFVETLLAWKVGRN